MLYLAVDHKIQHQVFRAQIGLALKLNKPMCLHIREADDDALRILEEEGVPPNYRIHLHCFNGDWDLCQRWQNKFSGLKIGITGRQFNSIQIIWAHFWGHF